MKFLIIGRGSMSKRRQRNLTALGHEYITWDIFDTVELSFLIKDYAPDRIIISSPPLTKQPYINMANKYNIDCFCEADVMAYKGKYTPSATMRYHPAIRRIKELIPSLGRLYTYSYQLGQHLRDWHKGADYTNYYAAKHETGGCKEMFCFELSWLMWLLGSPVSAVGFIDKALQDKDILADDVYASVVRFFNSSVISGTFLIDTVSRPAIRELRIVGEKGTLLWNWDDEFISIFSDESKMYPVNKGKAQEGYNENICEEMYIEEIKAFVKGNYSYTQAEENLVMNSLSRLEDMYA